LLKTDEQILTIIPIRFLCKSNVANVSEEGFAEINKTKAVSGISIVSSFEFDFLSPTSLSLLSSSDLTSI
jgi:hypothetical protein